MRRDDELCATEACAAEGCSACINYLAQIRADLARIRAELVDRLNRCDDYDTGLAWGWLIDNHPDLVREALDETGAPS